MAWAWKFISEPAAREQCRHIWIYDFIGIDKQFHHVEVRCERDGKYRKGNDVRCGYHTPGVGRKGLRRVPKDGREVLKR